MILLSMKGKFQGQDEIIILASKEEIWSVLIDTPALYEWMPIVKHSDGTKECLNAVRSCDVDFEGRKGKVHERCVLFEENKRIGWGMEYDTLGFSKMFNDYGFSFDLEEINPMATKVINKGYSTPKNIFASLMNLLMMKKKASQIRKTALQGLKKLAEK